ncbi:hypothetical protein [Mesorhizobium delmotii]|uniref:Uncharacterized protein n=1 Tax=Mesorhizobium delmotii TaxID=1631247 RepID=A0A2P9ARD8_9HYPH|nr:hypothetical protein [Mesorhizobium delmotii]SJM33647.1 hypothetical protein BQ8482_360048 [Mesorhizobium delmotii]
MTMPESQYNRPMTIVQAEALEAQKQTERDLADLHSGNGWAVAAIIFLLALTWLCDQFPALGDLLLSLWYS